MISRKDRINRWAATSSRSVQSILGPGPVQVTRQPGHLVLNTSSIGLMKLPPTEACSALSRATTLPTASEVILFKMESGALLIVQFERRVLAHLLRRVKVVNEERSIPCRPLK
jgi:hypothetical protein